MYRSRHLILVQIPPHVSGRAMLDTVKKFGGKVIEYAPKTDLMVVDFASAKALQRYRWQLSGSMFPR